VFATDYPQAIRTNEDCKDYVDAIKFMGLPGEKILHGNAAKLIPDLEERRKR
jgi:hypothetical protein